MTPKVGGRWQSLPFDALYARLGARPAEALASGLGLSATLGLLMLVPLLIGAYVDADHLRLTQASALITIEVIAAIVAVIATALFGKSLSVRRIGRIGAALAAIAYFLSAPGATFWYLVGCRIASGIGVGLLGAAVNVSVAQAAAPERLYATAVLFYGGLCSLLLYVIPVLCGAFGYWPLFGTVGLLFLVTGVATSALHDVRSERVPEASIAIHLEHRFHRRRTVGLIAGYFLLWIASSMVWVFAERKAASIHMGAAETGLALSVCTIVGLSGSLAVNWLGDRFGRALPIALGGSVLAVSFYALGVAAQPSVYWVAIIAYGIAYFFLLPYILGEAAELDSRGRIAMLTSLVPWVAHLVSPLLGATVLIKFGAFPAMAAVTAATAALATAILATAVRKHTKVNIGK